MKPDREASVCARPTVCRFCAPAYTTPSPMPILSSRLPRASIGLQNTATIAAAAMVAVFWRPMLALGKRELRIGIGLGVVYAVAQNLPTVGLAHTDASRSGFITGTYVVLTPIFTAVLLRERIPRSTWLAV